MKEVKLTQGKVALVDDCDYELVSGYTWHAAKGWNIYYAASSVHNSPPIRMHRLILGVNNCNIHVDHKDLDGLNNQRSNLRICSRTQNRANSVKRFDCSSGYKGVYFNTRNGKWHAQIGINNKRHHLGFFEDEIDAALTYDMAAKEHFGEFALLNF